MLGTVSEVAARVDGRVAGDGSVILERIASVEDAGPTTLTFATDERYLQAALGSRAAAVLTDAALAPADPPAKPLILVDSTRVALAAVLRALEPPRPRGPLRDPSAVVEASATIGEQVVIGPHVSIGAGTTIGDGVVIGAGCAIGPNARIGAGSLLHPRVTIADGCTLGARCIIQSGAVIGSDGFGYAHLDGRWVKIPQIGTVELGDDVEIGANTCIDRAQTGVTSIGDGTKIDNLVQVAHNCRIGRNCAIVAQVGLAGSGTFGDGVRVGGQAGFNGHISVGSRAIVAGQAGVWNDVREGAFVSGNPARPHRERLRLEVLIEKLPKLFARVDALESARKDESPPR